MKGRRERGSALLIVFVFAAIVAIMLYREMPVAAFEARRQKEELLIDRGNEYKHAIKTYVKKMGQFPPTIDALENTNRMRFLRHKFDDPITGKNDWRLIHAGPNRIILDSKVPTVNGANGGVPGAPGAPGSTPAGTGSAFGNNNANGATAAGVNNTNGAAGNSNGGFKFGAFSNSFGGSGDSPGANGTPTLAAVPQRAPAIAANGSRTFTRGNADPTGENGVPGQTDPNAAQPIANLDLGGVSTDAASQMRGLMNNPNPVAQATANGQQGSSFGSNSFGSNSSGSSFGSNSSNSSFGSNSSGSSFGSSSPGSSFGSNSPNSSFGSNSSGSSFGSNSANGSGSFGSNTNTPGSPGGIGNTGQGSSSFGGTFGQGTTGQITNGGGTGIAGVGSVAVGKTIKTVNEQTDFSKWEFYYDMAKDAATAMAGAMTGNTGQPGGQTPPGNSGSSFGSSSGFGSSGNGGSSFGNSGSSFGNNGSSGGSGFGSSGGSSGFGNSGGSSFGNSGSSFGNSGSSFGSTPSQTPGTSGTPPIPGQPQSQQ
jgi:hypothetical protein